MSYRFVESLLCVQWKTADDGQRNCPKHVEFYSKNKFEKLEHLVGFIIRIYHDAARSPERHFSLLALFFEATSLQYRRRQQVPHDTLWQIFAELDTSCSPSLFLFPDFKFFTFFINVPMDTLHDTHSKFSQQEIYNRLESIPRKRRYINHPRLLYSCRQIFPRLRPTAHLDNSLFHFHVQYQTQCAFVMNVVTSVWCDFMEICNVWTNCRKS